MFLFHTLTKNLHYVISSTLSANICMHACMSAASAGCATTRLFLLLALTLTRFTMRDQLGVILTSCGAVAWMWSLAVRTWSSCPAFHLCGWPWSNHSVRHLETIDLRDLILSLCDKFTRCLIFPPYKKEISWSCLTPDKQSKPCVTNRTCPIE